MLSIFMNEQIDYVYDRNTNLTFRYLASFIPSHLHLILRVTFQDLVFSADFVTHYI